MYYFRIKLRFLWFALLASMMLVIAPMQSAKMDAAWVEWCTDKGIELVQVPTKDQSGTGIHKPSCAVCLFAHMPLFFDSSIDASISHGLVFRFAILLSEPLLPKARIYWPQARAPPVLSQSFIHFITKQHALLGWFTFVINLLKEQFMKQREFKYHCIGFASYRICTCIITE
jgi:hypothetical protein